MEKKTNKTFKNIVEKGKIVTKFIGKTGLKIGKRITVPVILIITGVPALANENGKNNQLESDIPVGSDRSSTFLTLITNFCNLGYQIWKYKSIPTMDYPEFMAKCIEMLLYITDKKQQCEPTNRYFYKNKQNTPNNLNTAKNDPTAFLLAPNFTTDQILNLLPIFLTSFLALGTIILIIPIYKAEQKRLLENEEKGRYFSWW